MDEQLADDELILTIPVEAGVPSAILSKYDSFCMYIPEPEGNGPATGGEYSSIFFF